jgi:hypothetical protein
VSLGHERRAALMTGGDDPDPGVAQAVEQAEERLAGHREGVADPSRAQGIGHEPAHGPRPGVFGLEGGGRIGLGRPDGLVGRLDRLGGRLDLGLRRLGRRHALARRDVVRHPYAIG